MTKLSVNLNAVAYLRNRRDVGWPDLIELAGIILRAGAHGLTIHPRPDERHIRRRDVHDLADFLRKNKSDAEFNIEGYPSPEFLALVAEVKPRQVTLVPDAPEQATSDHGWALPDATAMLQPVIAALKKDGMRVSLFIDPDADVAAAAGATGTDRIEIHTGSYALARTDDEKKTALDKITAVIDAATGLGINAGHDLTLDNLPMLIARAPQIAEVSIGHGITADALKTGFAGATRAYLAALGG